MAYPRPRYLIEVDVDPRDSASAADHVEFLDKLEDRINAISDIPEADRLVVTGMWLYHGEHTIDNEAQRVFT